MISEKRRNTQIVQRDYGAFMYHGGNCFILLWLFIFDGNAIASTYLLENDILLTEGQLLDACTGGDPQPQPIVGGAFISCPVFVSFGAENGLSEGDHSGGGSPAYPSDGFYHAH